MYVLLFAILVSLRFNISKQAFASIITFSERDRERDTVHGFLSATRLILNVCNIKLFLTVIYNTENGVNYVNKRYNND